MTSTKTSQPLAIHYGREGTTRIDERHTSEGTVFAITKTLSDNGGCISRTAKDIALARHIYNSLAGLAE